MDEFSTLPSLPTGNGIINFCKSQGLPVQADWRGSPHLQLQGHLAEQPGQVHGQPSMQGDHEGGPLGAEGEDQEGRGAGGDRQEAG